MNWKTCPNGIAYCNILGLDKKARENFVLYNEKFQKVDGWKFCCVWKNDKDNIAIFQFL